VAALLPLYVHSSQTLWLQRNRSSKAHMTGGDIPRARTAASQASFLCVAVSLLVLAVTTGCAPTPSVASAAEQPPAPLSTRGRGEFSPGAVDGSAGGVTGAIGLTSVSPGQSATFRIQVSGRTSCQGWVSYSQAPMADWVVLEPISAAGSGELSWTWYTSEDVSRAGGFVTITCGGRAVHIPFAIGAPEIGTLIAR